MKLLFASGNPHKHEEIRQMLPAGFELHAPHEFGIDEDIPETGDTLEDNALQKAAYVRKRTNLPVFADDTGLEVEALMGAPGVRSARYAGPQKDADANMNKLLADLSDRRNRHAHVRTVIAFIDQDGEAHLFEGKVEGHIIREKRGEGGFGYDPIFVPLESDLSFAQMTSEQKNGISHRARALEQFMKHLRERS